jgi:hypothetical protein
MKSEWLDQCLNFSRKAESFYSGCRKIHTGVTFELTEFDDSLQIQDCGFTRNKLGMLTRLYYNDEQAQQVAELWRGRLKRNKYGSVGISTQHHITKSDPSKRSKRASVMGPCLLGVTLTLLEDKTIAIDCFYRTTELFKKFPADLVFIRDIVLQHFDIPRDRVRLLRFHFANVTCHPMYFVTLIPGLAEKDGFAKTVKPIDKVLSQLNRIKSRDQRFFDWTVKWTARYVCDEYMHGIEKFAQAMRVRKDALERIDEPMLDPLRAYLREYHPGYTRTRFKHGEEEVAVEEDDDEDAE